MAPTTQVTQQKSSFELSALLTSAGGGVLVSVLIAVVLILLPIGQTNIIEIIGALLPAGIVSLCLWLLELVLYFSLAWAATEHKLVHTILATILGFCYRLILVAGMALGVSVVTTGSFSAAFGYIHGPWWFLHFVALAVTAYVLHVVLARQLGNEKRAGSESSRANLKQFSFNSTRSVSAVSADIVRDNTSLKEENSFLAPPEGFYPVVAAENIPGIVNISSAVILESIPEAQILLTPDVPIRIRLAYIVPQLPRATVWLTWQQVFPGGNEDPNNQSTPRPDSVHFQSRWIRIPAKYYVLQVPREYFIRPAVVQPNWMKRPPVPQEAQFDNISS